MTYSPSTPCRIPLLTITAYPTVAGGSGRGKEDTCTARQGRALARSAVEPQIDAVVQEAAGTPAGRDPLSAATRTARDNGVNYARSTRGEPRVKRSKSQSPGRLAGTPEAEKEAGVRRDAVGTHREDPGIRAVAEAAAANQRARNAIKVTSLPGVAGGPRSAKATKVAARDPGLARPVRAVDRPIGPVRHPLGHVPHHVEHAPARLAIRPRTRVHRVTRGGDVPVGCSVVR